MGDRPVHKLPFGPNCRELFVILFFFSKKKAQFSPEIKKPETNLVNFDEDAIWTGWLAKTKSEDINVKYNIECYLTSLSPFNV